MEHELEIKLSAQMDNAIQTLDKLTNKMKQVTDASSSYENGIQNIIAELQKMNANLENSDSTAKFVERLRQLMTTIDKLNDVNLTAFRASLNDLFSTVQEALNSSSFADNGFTKIATALSKIVNSAIKLNGLDMNAFKQQLTSLSNTTQEVAKGFENIEGNDLNKTLSGIARNINKINKLDLRKTYETFNSLTRIIDPFLKKINESSVALNNFNEVAKSLQSSATSVRVINSEFTKYDKTVNSAKNSNTAFTKSLSGMVNILKRVFNFFYQGQSYIIDYTEQLNLFNVVMGNTGDKMSELGTKATQFQNTMLEAFGGNSSQQLYYQSMYQSISESMGIQEEYAYIISENLTKLSYDLSSLYNKSEDEVAKALQSGLVGQTRPVRSYGMDITQNSLTPVLESIGITDRTISQLNQAEKEVLRYIAIIRQSSVAHGDMANTINKIVAYIRNYIKKQLVNTYKSGVRIVNPMI